LFHQDAFLDGMSSAFSEFADRFEPEKLSEGFDHAMGGGLLSNWNKKAKYWQMYADLYPILTEKGGGRYPQMYAEEFVRAYERQIAEYKRLGGVDEHLKETVVLNEQHLDTDAIDDFEDEDSMIQAALEDSVIDQIDEQTGTNATVALGDISLDDLPDEEPADLAKG
jgi:hypothetical protein